MKEKLNKFSVPLGLLDYINPIFYTITMISIISNVICQGLVALSTIMLF